MKLGIGIGIGRQRFAGGFADSYSSRVLADGGTIESLSCVAGASALLQQASLLLIPSGYKAGTAYSALPNNSTGDLTWSRNSIAYRTQSNGNIGSVATNVPRLSYMYGSCPALLLEPQRTNNLLQSEGFESSSWTKTASSVTNNTTTSPNGNINADSLIEDTTNTLHQCNQTTTLLTGVYTASIFVKANGRSWVFLNIASAANYGVYFDIQNGVVGTIQSNITSATIQNFGNGWFRCIITASVTIAPRLSITIATANNVVSYLGDGTSGLYIFGAQLEAGAYATTYILTTNATATRLSDTFTRNNIYTNGIISASGGTWYVELKNNVSYVRDIVSSNALFIDTRTSGATNGFYIIGQASGRLRIGKSIATVNTAIYITTTDTVKIAIKWNGTTADVFANGVKVVSATAFTPTTMEFLNALNQDVPKFIQAMALFNAPLSDTDCATLTT